MQIVFTCFIITDLIKIFNNYKYKFSLIAIKILRLSILRPTTKRQKVILLLMIQYISLIQKYATCEFV